MAGSLLLIDEDSVVMTMLNIGASFKLADQAAEPYLRLSNTGPNLLLKDLP